MYGDVDRNRRSNLHTLLVGLGLRCGDARGVACIRVRIGGGTGVVVCSRRACCGGGIRLRLILRACVLGAQRVGGKRQVVARLRLRAALLVVCIVVEAAVDLARRAVVRVGGAARVIEIFAGAHVVGEIFRLFLTLGKLVGIALHIRAHSRCERVAVIL